MGKGKKESAGKAEAKAKKQAKAAEKAGKTAKKQAKKEGVIDSDEEDIEAILAKVAAADAAKTAVTVSAVAAPSARVNSTLTPLPSGELVLFGGEYFDGQINTCYNEIYRFLPKAGSWSLVSSPNSPAPRCSHQAALVGNTHIYVYGGEFATANQFYHHGDTWKFELSSNRWSRLETKKAPSARSGHRMLSWRNYLLCFGGFYQTLTHDKWYGDLWYMDTRAAAACTWTEAVYPPTISTPAPRSGCGFVLVPNRDTAIMSGGYSEVRTGGAADAGVLGKGGKAGGGKGGASSASLLAKKTKSMVHQDVWVLKLAPLLTGGMPAWERVRTSGVAPSPRLGFSMTAWRDRVIVFGGVKDEEDERKKGEDVKSEFFNNIFALDTGRKRWYALDMKKKKAGGERRRREKTKGAKASGGAGASAEEGGEEEEEDVELSDEEDEEEDIAHAAKENDVTGLDDTAFYYFVDGKLVKLEAEDEEDEEEGAAEAGGGADKHSTAAAESGTPSRKGKTADTADAPAAAAAAAAASSAESAAADAAAAVSALSLKPAAASSTAAAAAAATDGAGAAAAAAAEPAAPMPLGRIRAHTWVDGHTLWVYGGLHEDQEHDREVTLDDLWKLDLQDRGAWECVTPGAWATQAWKGEEESEDEEEEDDDESDDEEDEDEEEGDGEEEEGDAGEARGGAGAGSSRFSRSQARNTKEAARIRQLREQLDLLDASITPQPGEELSLRVFWLRCAESFVKAFLASGGVKEGEKISGKDVRRKAFALAKVRFEEIWPILAELHELEEAQREMEAAAAEARKGKGGGGSKKR